MTESEIRATEPEVLKKHIAIGGNSESQYISILKGYFERAQKGDLVVIPPSGYSKDVILAEFIDDPKDFSFVSFPDRYGSFPIPVRRYKTLATVQKRLLPISLLNILAKPNAFVHAGESSREFLYRTAYGSFAFGGKYSSQFEVSSHHFNFEDNLHLSAFIKFVSTNTMFALNNEEEVMPVWQAATADIGDYIPTLQSNLQSPGIVNLTSRYVVPLVVLAIFALALEPQTSTLDDAKSGSITIENSGAPKDDASTIQISDSTITQMRMLGAENWAEAREIARKVNAETGLTPRPKIIVRREPDDDYP